MTTNTSLDFLTEQFNEYVDYCDKKFGKRVHTMGITSSSYT